MYLYVFIQNCTIKNVICSERLKERQITDYLKKRNFKIMFKFMFQKMNIPVEEFSNNSGIFKNFFGLFTIVL